VIASPPFDYLKRQARKRKFGQQTVDQGRDKMRKRVPHAPNAIPIVRVNAFESEDDRQRDNYEERFSKHDSIKIEMRRPMVLNNPLTNGNLQAGGSITEAQPILRF